MLKDARVMVVGRGHRVKVKFVGGSFLPHRLAGGATCGRFHNDWQLKAMVNENLRKCYEKAWLSVIKSCPDCDS